MWGHPTTACEHQEKEQRHPSNTHHYMNSQLISTQKHILNILSAKENMLIKEIMNFGNSYHIGRDSVVGEVTESIVTKRVVDLFRCFQQRFIACRDRFFLVRFCNTFYIYGWNHELLTIHVWRGKGGSEYGRGDATQSGESENCIVLCPLRSSVP